MDSLTWHHPTGKAPKIVALLCLGPSKEHYIGAQLARDLTEVTDGVDEVWTLNRGGGAFRHDLLWVMDHIQGEADQYPRYGASLWRHDKPIITSDDADGWPAHVHRYPFRLIWNWLAQTVQPNHGDWYHNSLAYILPYAAWIGVRELRVFGADYHHHSSGVVEDGHPCVAYWAGRLESAGLVVRPSEGSGFLNADRRDWIYGYRHDPRTAPARRARFRALVGLDADGESTQLLSGERQVAADLEHIQPDHIHRYSWAANQASGRVLDLGAGIGYGSALLADRASVSHVLAVDRSQESIEYGIAHYARPNLVRVRADLDGQPAPEGEFDCAVAFELIEHLADPRPLLRSIQAKTLFLSVPNEAVIPYSPETAPFHHRHYRLSELTALLSDCGWITMEIAGQDGPESPVMPTPLTPRTWVVRAERGTVG